MAVYADLKARLGPFQRAEVFGNVDCVRLQLGQVDHLQRPDVGCCQHHGGSDSGVVGLSPRSATTHRSPGPRPGKPYSGIGVIKSLPTLR